MRLMIVCLLSVTVAGASDWPRFRGPNGSGISAERNLPEAIAKDRNVLWKVKTPQGNSSPIVAAGRIFITGHEGDERITLCYDAEKGTLLWRAAVTKARTETPNPLNGPTTPTPATDGRSVFVFYPELGLIAYDFAGKELWQVPLGPFGGVQGMASSPVYAVGLVVLLIDTPETAYLAAFDAKTGKQRWKIERPIGFLGSYATPSVYQPPGGPEQIVVAGALELTGYDGRTGERLWWASGVTYAPAALPLVAGESVYTIEPATGAEAPPPFSGWLKQFDKNKNASLELDEVAGDNPNAKIMTRIIRSIDKNSGNGDGAVTEEEYNRAFNPAQPSGGLVRTRLGGKGDVTKSHAGWRHRKGLPYVTAPVLYDGVLYVVRNGGILSTFNPETGELQREERLKDAVGEYYAQPVAGDGKIYFINHDGKTSVIRAGAKWEMLSSGDLDEAVIATPAIAGSRIYVRTNGTLYCFGTAKS
jgi:outer membrane protein assembly factor BamB